MTYENKINYLLILTTTVILGIIFLFILSEVTYGQTTKLSMDNGIASGDVKNDSAIIWSRTNSDSFMNVEYSNSSNFNHSSSNPILKTPVNSLTNFTGHIKLSHLNPNTIYYYSVWFSDVNDSNIKSANATGKFKTAPNVNDLVKQINFIIGGDLAGSSSGKTLCRQVDMGYPIFSVMKSVNPDFFIFNGDQIYADYSCPENIKNRLYPYWKNIPGNFSSVNDVDWNNITKLYETFLAHWQYNRGDSHQQSLLASTSMYSQADDHEVTDNYGGQWDFLNPHYNSTLHNKTGYPNLVKTGIDVFLKYSPIDRNQSDPDRIYRMFNWGKDLDLFLLDDHSYRSKNDLPDTEQNHKTLYGKEQLDWLKNGLLNSKATWKVISNPVPISLPDCYGQKGECNSWATNSSLNQLSFTKERSQFLKFLDDKNIKNVVFVTTDVHFAGTVKVEKDFNKDNDKLVIYEMASGPLSTNTQNTTNAVDPTINAKYLYNENAIFNFGHVNITSTKNDGVKHLLYEVIDSNGRIRPNSSLDLTPMS